MKMVIKENTDFLDASLISTFRKTINSSKIFHEHEMYKHKYNLICVFMDRIDSAIAYLNAHSDVPTIEEDFIIFLVFAAILRDGINELYKEVFNKKPSFTDDKKYFSNALYYNRPYFTDETCPTDDDFFEYLRAMAFAHPYNVSGRESTRPFLKKGEVHYCPWVVIYNHITSVFSEIEDAVGIRVYSNLDEESIKGIYISFSSLKDYLKSRYERIAELNKWAENSIIEQNKIWIQEKVNRNQPPIIILKDIVEILKNRFEETDTVEVALKYLECPLTIAHNAKVVEIYRETITAAIPLVCDSVDNLNYKGIESALSILYIRPKKMHKEGHYQLEKIDLYLTERSEHIDRDSNEFWGLVQAYDFSKEFAKKWVSIDILNMSYDEIKLLVHTACYMEAMDQCKTLLGN